MLLRLTLTSFLVTLLSVCFSTGSLGDTAFVDLTKEEREWLSDKSFLRVGVGRAFPPFMWAEENNGKTEFKGIVKDYIELLSRRLDIEMEVVFDKPFDELLDDARSGKIDLFPLLSYTPDRSEFLDFTQPYLRYPMVIITRDDGPLVKSISDLKGKRFAVVKHLVIYSKIQQDYSDLNLDFVFSKKVDENLDLIATGKADACIINLAAASTYIYNKGLSNLKIAAEVDWEPIAYSMAVRNDAPILKAIIEKAISSLTNEEKASISKRWIKLEFDTGVKVELIVRWVFVIAAVILLFATIFIVWNRRLMQEISAKEKAQTKLLESEEKLKLYSENLEKVVEEKTAELKIIQQEALVKEKLAAIGQLAGGVAHDIRNPLGAISNSIYYLGEIESEINDTRLSKHTKLMFAEIQRANEIISDLLEVSREVDPDFRMCDIHPIIEDALNESVYQLGEIDIKKTFGSLIPEIEIDRLQVQRVLVNLIVNACQAMNEKGTLTIETFLESSHVYISISDSGQGIIAENIERVFDPLFTTKAKGVGLGLAIVKSFVEKNRGEIEISSSSDTGTTFTICFPIST